MNGVNILKVEKYYFAKHSHEDLRPLLVCSMPDARFHATLLTTSAKAPGSVPTIFNVLFQQRFGALIGISLVRGVVHQFTEYSRNNLRSMLYPRRRRSRPSCSFA